MAIAETPSNLGRRAWVKFALPRDSLARDRELQALDSALRALKAGDFSVRLPPVGSDPPTRVATAFNDVAMLLDATRSRAEASSREFNTMQLLQAYERAIDESIISSITDTKGTILHVNQRFCEISQYTSAELVGQTHRIVNSGFHPPSFFTGMWRTIGSGQVWHDEVKNRAKDGSTYWVDTVVVPIKDDDHRNTHYLSLRSLITDRKDVEEKSKKYLDALEGLLVLTSNRVRRPLATCLELLRVLDPGQPGRPGRIRETIAGLKATATELDAFTKDLGAFIRDMKR